ncbi:MAG: 30S ribosomal protein S20 [Bacteroidota bacterium]
MPNIKSAEKRVRVARVRTLRNASTRSSVKTAVKKYDAQIGKGDASAAEAALRKAMSAIDKAAKKGVIHRNQAARRKSRLAKKLVALAGAQGAPAAQQ